MCFARLTLAALLPLSPVKLRVVASVVLLVGEWLTQTVQEDVYHVSLSTIVAYSGKLLVIIM